MADQNDKTTFMPNGEDPTQFKQTNLENSEGTTFGTSSSPELLSRSRKKIAGFLFSFSKNEYGEFWVIYHGRNTIGSGSSNTIRLLEKSVSDKHALLLARVIDNNQLIFEFRDEGSSLGTILNNQDMFHFKNYAVLNHGDVMKIGGYELVFYAVDDYAMNLKPNSLFNAMMDHSAY